MLVQAAGMAMQKLMVAGQQVTITQELGNGALSSYITAQQNDGWSYDIENSRVFLAFFSPEAPDIVYNEPFSALTSDSVGTILTHPQFSHAKISNIVIVAGRIASFVLDINPRENP